MLENSSALCTWLVLLEDLGNKEKALAMCLYLCTFNNLFLFSTREKQDLASVLYEMQSKTNCDKFVWENFISCFIFSHIYIFI